MPSLSFLNSSSKSFKISACAGDLLEGGLKDFKLGSKVVESELVESELVGFKLEGTKMVGTKVVGFKLEGSRLV